MNKFFCVTVKGGMPPKEGLIIPATAPHYAPLPHSMREILDGLPDGNYIVGEDYLATLVFGPVYRASGGQVQLTKYIGVFDVIAGEGPYYFTYPALNCHMGEEIKSREALFSYEYLSKEEAEEAAEIYVRDMEPHRIDVPYGSQVHGESRDIDIVAIYQRGSRGQEILDDFAGEFSIPRHTIPEADRVFLWDDTDNPFLRLVVACMEAEYGAEAVHRLLDGFAIWGVPLGEAIQENAERRREIAKEFPVDFTIRKAIFASLQYRAWEEKGTFVDGKSRALEYASLEEYPLFNRILFHEAQEGDVEKAYKLLFSEPYQSSDKVLMLQREYFVWKDGQLFRGCYSSHYGWEPPTPCDPVHLHWGSGAQGGQIKESAP